MKKIIYLLLIVLLSCLAISCGKKSNPTPIFEGNMMTWRNVSVDLLDNGCLVVNAEILGKTDDVREVVFELEPVTDNVCVTCPFLPVETTTINNIRSIYNNNSLLVNFNYCPENKADSYRYRLGAVNVNPVYPVVTTTPKVVESQKAKLGLEFLE